MADVSQHAAFTTTLVDKEDDLDYDLGNLAAFDSAALDAKAAKRDMEGYLGGVARDNVQLLFAKLFALPQEETDVGNVIQLPEASTSLPREKPVPQPPAKTRWQAFAESKGIRNRKRGRMELDDISGEYKPRWGYGRAKKIEDDWVVEANGTDALPGADPFAARAEAKREKKEKQAQRELRNVKEALGKQGKPLPGNLGLAATAPKEKRQKTDLAHALKSAQRSTASYGRFDERVSGEPNVKKGERQRFAPNEQSIAQEAADNNKLLRRILGDESVVDTGRAADMFLNTHGQSGGGGGKGRKAKRKQQKGYKGKAGARGRLGNR